MPTNFPEQLDEFQNPTAQSAQNSELIPHSGQHANANDAIEALQTKIGVDGSTDPDSLDYKLAHKVDQVSGKGLSQNDYSDAEKTKLSGIAEGANNYTHPAQHAPSIITQDANNRFVSDAEKATWSGKQPAGTYATGTGSATGTNTGDETATTIKSKLGVSTLSGSNTGDQTLPTLASLGAQSVANEDASNGYAGLTLFKLNMKNVAGSIVSFFTNTNTVARTYSLPDKDGIVAMTSDITGTNSGTNTGDETAATIKTKLGITTLSGSNTGDQTLASLGAQAALGFTPYNATNPSGFQTAAQVDSRVQQVVGAAPAALDTLVEIAAQLAADENAVSALVATVAGKEPAIAAGTTAQYWSGNKAWVDFTTTVRATVLTGLSLATNAAISATDTVLSALGKLQKQVTDLVSAKDATGGYAGLTLFKINFRNAANTFTSFFTNTNTAGRTYTFQNKNGTIADLADVATKQDASAALTDFVAAATGVGDAITDVPRNAELGTAAYVDLESVPQNVFPVLVSTARTLTLDDSGKTFVVSGTTTVTLPLAADVFNASVPYNVAVKAITGATVTVARSGSDTIETVAGNKSLTANTGLVFFPTSSSTWETI